MRNSFIIVQFLVGLVTLGACVHPADYTYKPEPLDLKLDKLLRDAFYTCDRSDDEQKIPAEIVPSAIKIQGEEKIGDIRKTDCDGKVTVTHGVLQEFSQMIRIDPPTAFNEKVQKIRVSNSRTCARTEIAVTSEDSLDKPTSVDWLKNFSQAGELGGVRLFVINTTSKLGIGLPIHPGNNLLEVEYMGKCLKLDKPQEGSKNDPSCLEYEILGKKTLLLQAAIHTTDTAGVGKESHDSLCGK